MMSLEERNKSKVRLRNEWYIERKFLDGEFGFGAYSKVKQKGFEWMDLRGVSQ